MVTYNIRKYIVKGLVCCSVAAAFTTVVSCKEDIDESNLYTFTGETIEDYLANRPERFSDFNYILARIGYDKILSAYGTYTCFAPTNEAVQQYLDSLYDDPVNLEIPHNGMTQRGLEGLTDSLCEDIALFHLLGTEELGVNMGNGMTIKTKLGRDINTSIDSITGAVIINRASSITSMDNELENGVLHEIDCVIRRSNMLIAGEMDSHADEYSLFSQALKVTGLADSLTNISRTDFDHVDKPNFYLPEKCELGYTIFAETDDVLAERGIHNIDDLKAYADEIYAKCAEPGNGWYDYARNHGIQISTGTDYKNPWNTLSMFVRYHILDYKIPYDKLVHNHNQISKVTLVEYYETMLPYTLLKITRNNNRLYLNRQIANNSLTDLIAELGTAGMHTVLFNGIEMVGDKGQYASVNGYIHSLKDILVYDQGVPEKALNERMRFDDTAFLGEMMSNSFRRISDSEVRALNGGKEGADGNLSGNYIRIPPGFLKDLVIYNGDDTRLYYLPGQSSGWSNYQGDEFNCKGRFDFAFRLPPVPDDTYELRIGYTANGNRGMLQFYLGSSSELSDMKALDIPLDMRVVPDGSATADAPDVNTGWCNWNSCDDKGVETDANMRNLGYMRGPLYYTVGINTGNYARSNREDLRRIIAKQPFEQGEYWLRFKTVLEGDAWQFHLDYIEFCPENVYNNSQYAEDMY